MISDSILKLVNSQDIDDVVLAMNLADSLVDPKDIPRFKKHLLDRWKVYTKRPSKGVYSYDDTRQFLIWFYATH